MLYYRIPQGMSIDPRSNIIWSHEHDPRGGDEVNVIKKGANYGWPTNRLLIKKMYLKVLAVYEV